MQLTFVCLLCILSSCCSCLSAPGVIFSVVWCVLYMQSCHLQIKIFIYSFPICINLYPFLQWLVGLPVDVKSDSERGHPCWAPDHGGIQVPFLCYEAGCRCIMDGLSGWISFPIFLICWELLSWMTDEFCETCFLNWYDHIFFFCSLLMWYSTVRDFWLMNQQKIPGHSVWLFLYIIKLFLLIFYYVFCNSVHERFDQYFPWLFKVCLIWVKIGETESLEGTGMGEMPFSQLVLSSCKVISPTE